jgi:hypothetical protein
MIIYVSQMPLIYCMIAISVLVIILVADKNSKVV